MSEIAVFITNSLSISPLERSRKAYSNVLQVLNADETETQEKIALAMGVSPSTVSRAKNSVEDVLALLYQIGFKVVPSDRICVDRKRYEALETIARAAMADEENSKKLFWEQE